MLKLKHRKEVRRLPNAEKIKARMAELNITQAGLAEYLGVATPTICQKINNLRPFTLDEAERVALLAVNTINLALQLVLLWLRLG